MVQVFYHDNKDTPADFTDEHNSGKPVSLEELERIGVIYRKIDSSDELEQLASERSYKNRDTVHLNLDTFGGDIEAYNAKMTQFYKEHYHEDEEIRYILEGEGYFDVRNKGDNWIRIKCDPKDLLILPAGIYHRFTLTSALKNVKAVRLFKDEPKWEAINRETGRISEARTEYVNAIAAV